MINQFQSGLEPVGHFDFLDSEISSINGGEVVVLDTIPDSVSDLAAPDVWEDPPIRVAARKATGGDRGPFYLVDSNRSTIGESEVGFETTTLFSTASSFIRPDNVSGKLSLWAQEGFYSISTDVIESDIDTSTQIYAPLYASDNGYLTTAPSLTAQIVGYFIEYRRKAIVDQQLGRFQYAGTSKLNDTVIIYKSNADGYLNFDFMSDIVGRLGTLGTPTDGSYADGYYSFTSTTTLADAADQLNEGLGDIATGNFPVVIGTPTDGTYSDGYFAFTSTTLLSDAIDSLNEQVQVLTDNVATISTGTLYVNHNTGNDGYDGYATTPLATIQEAVNRFLPLEAGIQTWNFGEDRYIRVQDPGGANSNFEESIIIPPHGGLGVLYIIGAETTEISNAELDGVTVFTTLSTNQVRRNMFFEGFVTGPSDARTDLDDSGFWVPQVIATADPFRAQLEMLPHVNFVAGGSGADQARVVCMLPGSRTAFDYNNNAIVDMVSPATTWQPGPSEPTDGILGLPCITNNGGPLIVQGFNFTPREDAGQGSNGSVIYNSGNVHSHGDPEEGVSTVWLSRCIINDSPVNGNTFYDFFHGSNIAINIISKGSTWNLRVADNVKNLSIVNTKMDTPDARFYDSSLMLYGMDSENSGSLVFDSCTIGNCYLDSDGPISVSSSVVTIEALSIINAGPNAGIKIISNSTLNLPSNGTRLSGTSGNTGVGLHIDTLSVAYFSGIAVGSYSLSGSGGNVQVGGNAARTWAAGAETDTVELARYRSF